MSLPYQRMADGLIVAVRLTPRGGRDAIDGIGGAADGTSHLKARVRVAAEDGKANAALIALIANWLGIGKSAITLASGATSRQKRLKVEGDADALSARIEALLATVRD